MKYKVYFGYGTDFNNKEILGTFKTSQDAEEFVYKHIKENHKKSQYIRKTIVNDSFIWYDYGSYTKFYTIKKHS